MTLYKIKPAFQNLLRPGVRLLARWGVTANQVTIAAMLLSAAGGALLIAARREPLLFLTVPAVLLLRMAMNAVDGMLAREHDMQSRLGAVLNEMGDIISDILLYLPFALFVSPWPVFAFVLLAAISETAGIMGLTIGGGRRYDGPLGKSDRAFVMGGLSIAFAAGAVPGQWTELAFALMSVLLVVTIFNRIRKALAENPTEPAKTEEKHDTFQ